MFDEEGAKSVVGCVGFGLPSALRLGSVLVRLAGRSAGPLAIS